MGIYNPYAPQILGQEWAPIRDEDLAFSPAVNALEIGHEFSLATSRVLQDGRFYLEEFPSAQAEGQTFLISIYAKGGEAYSGPVHRTLIPVSNGGVTGATLVGSSASTVADALLNASDNGSILFGPIGTVTRLRMFFPITSYNTLLAGKRILGLNLLYSATGDFADMQADASLPELRLRTDAGTNVFYGYLTGTEGTSTTTMALNRGNFGEVNPFWDSATLPTATSERLPWTFTRLQALEVSAIPRIAVDVSRLTPNVGQFSMFYAALEVIFCEEQRLAYGGRAFGADTGNPLLQRYILGMNSVPLRTVASLTANPVLPIGDYTVTLSSADTGDLSNPNAFTDAVKNSIYPKLDGLRELYQIPTHRGLRIDLPFPPEDRVGEVFTKVETRILPQLSIHTSGGPLTEVHVYGRQAIAQVYGSITATQDILDSAAGGAASWPWVRFYARRFGETTVPLLLDCATIAGSTVVISPEDFDALDEIIDGWKEITLRFDTPPTMGAGTTPQWRWSATGEVSGNRWEILGASAPAVSGIPGNLLNLVPSPNQLSSATYGQPSAGASVNLGWIPQYAPAVTATADDQTSDAVILFAQDMRTITGLAAATQTQDLTGIGLNCDVAPCCIPTALLYHRITWPLPYGTGTADDTFTRTEAAGSWGSADSGQAYTLNGTAGDFSVDGSAGLIIPTATGSNREAWISVGGPDQDVTVELEISDAAETNQLWGGVLARLTDASNYYRATMRYTSTSTVELRLDKRVAGVETNLATVTLPLLSPSALTPRTIRLQVAGAFIRAKLWDTDTTEPWWQLYTTDTALTTGNNAGCFARDDTTVASTTFTFDNLVVAPPDFGFGYYELQRSDTVETDWATIMKATSVATTGFSDYEARVATLSSYRIRAVDVYGFEGPWSSEVDLFLPTPGASGGCITSPGHVLLFTANERQDGSINLAYSTAWEANQTVDESFQFSEANFVQMQGMYNRDYFVAFRPLERGGERFQRTLLVQAAAISPPTLGDFRGLRDMAWDTVSYICVRDEDANRWLATVIVPSGRVLRDRRLYLAPVDIIEVTATPAPVDP